MLRFFKRLIIRSILPPIPRAIWINEQQEQATGTYDQWLLNVYDIPYGLHSDEDWRIADEVERRWKTQERMDTPSTGFPQGIHWPDSDDPNHPSNNRSHPYFIR